MQNIFYFSWIFDALFELGESSLSKKVRLIRVLCRSLVLALPTVIVYEFGIEYVHMLMDKFLLPLSVISTLQIFISLKLNSKKDWVFYIGIPLRYIPTIGGLYFSVDIANLLLTSTTLSLGMVMISQVFIYAMLVLAFVWGLNNKILIDQKNALRITALVLSPLILLNRPEYFVLITTILAFIVPMTHKIKARIYELN